MSSDELYELMDRISCEMAAWDRDDKYVNLCKAAFDVAFCLVDGPAGGGMTELPDCLCELRVALDNYDHIETPKIELASAINRLIHDPYEDRDYGVSENDAINDTLALLESNPDVLADLIDGRCDDLGL